MKKNTQIAYRDQLIELGKLYKVEELRFYAKTKKDLTTESAPKTVSNNLFVGSTAELQKFLKKGKDGVSDVSGESKS